MAQMSFRSRPCKRVTNTRRQTHGFVLDGFRLAWYNLQVRIGRDTVRGTSEGDSWTETYWPSTIAPQRGRGFRANCGAAD
jgi:ribosomal protein L34